MEDPGLLVGRCHHCHIQIQMAKTYGGDKPFYFNPRPNNSLIMTREGWRLEHAV